jgi:hypothetical protein
MLHHIDSLTRRGGNKTTILSLSIISFFSFSFFVPFLFFFFSFLEKGETGIGLTIRTLGETPFSPSQALTNKLGVLLCCSSERSLIVV